MDRAQSAEAFCRDIWRLYLEERRYDLLDGVVGDSISVIGTGAHEVSRNREEFAAAMACERREWEGRFSIREQWYQTSPLSDTLSLVIGEIKAREVVEEGVPYDIRFRFTVLLEDRGDGWRLRHIHQSVPDPNQTGDEFFPYHMVEKNMSQVIYNLRHDAMTGLLNRRYLEEIVNRFLNHTSAGVLVMLDVDKFKHLNDSYGHPFGDRVLIVMAQSLKTSFGPDLSGRIGGDEFAAFLPGIRSLPEAAPLLEGFQRDWAERQQALGISDIIAASMGAAVCPRDGTDYDALWKSADEALYQSKREKYG